MVEDALEGAILEPDVIDQAAELTLKDVRSRGASGTSDHQVQKSYKGSAYVILTAESEDRPVRPPLSPQRLSQEANRIWGKHIVRT